MPQEGKVTFIGVAQKHSKIGKHLITKHESHITGKDGRLQRFHNGHIQIPAFSAETVDIDDNGVQPQFISHIGKCQRIFPAVGIADKNRIFPFFAFPRVSMMNFPFFRTLSTVF